MFFSWVSAPSLIKSRYFKPPDFGKPRYRIFTKSTPVNGMIHNNSSISSWESEICKNLYTWYSHSCINVIKRLKVFKFFENIPFKTVNQSFESVGHYLQNERNKKFKIKQINIHSKKEKIAASTNENDKFLGSISFDFLLIETFWITN